MKKKTIACLLISIFSVSSVFAGAIVEDDFNSYSNGSVVGQGGWESYINGSNFIVQEAKVFEGTKGLLNSSTGDSVIFKTGNTLTDGKQVFYINIGDRTGWTDESVVQLRLLKNNWNSTVFCVISFEKNGRVGYSIGGGIREYFATYESNEWLKLDVEWRSADKKARYSLNNEPWTDWDIFWNSTAFTEFDTVGINLDLRGASSGSVYVDNLTIPEPLTIVLLINGLIAMIFPFRFKK